MIVTDIALVWIAMLVFHELGHFIPLRIWRGRSVEIRFYYESLKEAGFKVGMPEHYEGLPLGRNIAISIIGIAAGFIPLIIFLFFIGGSLLYFWTFISLLVVYTAGCYHDISKARRLRIWAKRNGHSLQKPL